VADDLRALDDDAAHVEAARHAMELSQRSLDLQRKSYAAGKGTLLQLIDAERTYAQARLSLATVQIQQYPGLAGPFVALGGGWWHDPAAAPSAPTYPHPAATAAR
jgi:outer membrane protein TolC